MLRKKSIKKEMNNKGEHGIKFLKYCRIEKIMKQMVGTLKRSKILI